MHVGKPFLALMRAYIAPSDPRSLQARPNQRGLLEGAVSMLVKSKVVIGQPFFTLGQNEI